MKRSTLIYALSCVMVPVAWGLVVVWLSNRVEDWVRRHGPASEDENGETPLSTLDYHI